MNLHDIIGQAFYRVGKGCENFLIEFLIIFNNTFDIGVVQKIFAVVMFVIATTICNGASSPFLPTIRVCT